MIESEYNKDGLDVIHALGQFASDQRKIGGALDVSGPASGELVSVYAGREKDTRLLVMFAGLGQKGESRMFARTFSGTLAEVNEASGAWLDEQGRQR